MIGDAVPIKFSKRIGRKARLSSFKIFITKDTKRSPVKKRVPVKRRTPVKKTSNAVSLLLKEADKNGVGRKCKSRKNSTRASHDKSSLCLGTKKNVKKSNSKPISKQALHNLKPTVHKRPRNDESRIIGQKRKTRNSLNASQLDLTDTAHIFSFPKVKEKKISRKSRLKKGSKPILDDNSFFIDVTKKSKIEKKCKLKKNSKQISKEASYKLKQVAHKVCSKDISEIFNQKRKIKNSFNVFQDNLKDNEKKASIRKKNHVEITSNKKQSNCESWKGSKSVMLTKKKGTYKELNVSKPKSSKVKKPAQKKGSLDVTCGSSKSFLTPNTRKSTQTSRHSKKNKIERVSTKSLSQAVSFYTPTYRHLGNRKSTRSSKELNQSRVLNSGISLYTSAFQSILETPYLKKNQKKKKSPRLIELSPLKTLNKKLSPSTPASVFGKKHSSLIKKSNSSKSSKLQAASNHNEKCGKLKVSKKKVTTDSCEKLKLHQRQLVNKKKVSENFKIPLPKETENLPMDMLSTPAFESMRVKNQLNKYIWKSNSESSKRKFHALSTENLLRSDEVQIDKKRRKSTGFTNVPVKGTLKHKRWLLNNLKETNVGYEDDIFENQNFSLYKTSFHFGDESDGSSVNIATPKFDCILTPVLPKKTPRFKDCISTTDLLQARKSAEEYLHRRNKKRKSGDRLSSSGKKTSTNKKNTTRDMPEKKKLDFEEAVNKLIAVQKDLEKDAEINDVDEDSYFSDSSI